MPRKRSSSPATSRPKAQPGNEWLLGLYEFPYEVLVADQPMRPTVGFCLELPAGKMLAVSLGTPGEPISLPSILRAAMERPAVGKPRRPAQIRVSSKAVAAGLGAIAGDDVSILVAPTPELEAAFDALAEQMSGSRAPSYFDGGATSEDLERLFLTAADCYRAAPWKVVSEEQLVRVDSPNLGLHGTCLSVIGGVGASFGILLFPSLDQFLLFADVAEEAARTGKATPTEVLSLSFDRAADLPASMRREIKEHGWKVAGSRAYPSLMAIDAKGQPRLATGRDVEIVTKTVGAFLAFFEKSGLLFEAALPLVTSMDFEFEGCIITLTAPYLEDAAMEQESWQVQPRTKRRGKKTKD